LPPGKALLLFKLEESGGKRGADDGDRGITGQQAPDLAFGDRAAADYQARPTGDMQIDRIKAHSKL
jgi:hypothetical protein